MKDLSKSKKYVNLFNSRLRCITFFLTYSREGFIYIHLENKQERKQREEKVKGCTPDLDALRHHTLTVIING